MRRDALRLSITLLSVLPAAGRRPETARSPGEKAASGGSGGPPGPAGTAPLPGLAAPGPVQAAPDREIAGEAMAWAPVVGLLLGVIAAAVLYVSSHLLHTGSLVAAAVSVGSLAVLTRALHLDGLADL